MFDLPTSELWLIVGFAVLIPVMLILDLGFFNKKSHKVSNKEALSWTGVWVGLALIFGAIVYAYMGEVKASEFYTAFLIEKALSVDNLFVFILVFQFFKVPDEHQHKVLFWGIIGAIVLRAIFIFTGAGLIRMTYLTDFDFWGLTSKASEWTFLGNPVTDINPILIVFGAFLIYAGIKSLKSDDDDDQDFSNSLGVRIVKNLFPVVDKYDGGKFFTYVNENGSLKKVGTMLLVVVGVIEVTDLIFAVDSIPAIFTVSRDPFILYTSNIFAILGLRTLYFLLNNFMQYFTYLKYGLAFILAFIGLKMIIAPIFHISSPVSLSVVGGVLLISTLASVVWKPKAEVA